MNTPTNVEKFDYNTNQTTVIPFDQALNEFMAFNDCYPANEQPGIKAQFISVLTREGYAEIWPIGYHIIGK